MHDPSHNIYDLLPPPAVITVLIAGWGLILYWVMTLNEDDDNWPTGAP